jgi:hypothetical protein
VRLAKELMAVAGRTLKQNMTTLGPRVLPISEKVGGRFAAGGWVAASACRARAWVVAKYGCGLCVMQVDKCMWATMWMCVCVCVCVCTDDVLWGALTKACLFQMGRWRPQVLQTSHPPTVCTAGGQRTHLPLVLAVVDKQLADTGA